MVDNGRGHVRVDRCFFLSFSFPLEAVRPCSLKSLNSSTERGIYTLIIPGFKLKGAMASAGAVFIPVSSTIVVGMKLKMLQMVCSPIMRVRERDGFELRKGFLETSNESPRALYFYLRLKAN